MQHDFLNLKHRPILD